MKKAFPFWLSFLLVWYITQAQSSGALPQTTKISPADTHQVRQ